MPTTPAAALSADELSALLRTISDGRPHALRELARIVTDDGEGTAGRKVLAELASLQSEGMPMVVADGSVRARAFTPLDVDAVDRHLGSGHRWTTRVVPMATSTNSELLAECRRSKGAHGASVLAAEVQRNGRGRSGRQWFSAPGVSLTVSFALPLRVRLSALGGVTLVCGLALHDALRSCGLHARLKWPNDLLVEGRKVAGILVEVQASDDITTLVIGIGVNIAPVPAPDVAKSGVSSMDATSLQESGLGSIDRNALIARIAQALEDRIAFFVDAGFPAVADEWNALDAFHDRQVRLVSADGTVVVGVARGVDDGGALLLEVDGVRRHVIVGDLSLRPIAAAPHSKTPA